MTGQPITASPETILRQPGLVWGCFPAGEEMRIVDRFEDMPADGFRRFHVNWPTSAPMNGSLRMPASTPT